MKFGMLLDNSALNGSGGGIAMFGGTLTLTREFVSINDAAINGGGICMGGGTDVPGGTVIISGGSIQSNTAGNSGGGIYNVAGALSLGVTQQATVNDNVAAKQGGGLYLASPSKTRFNDCLVSGNGTTGNQANTGWGVYWQNGGKVFGLPAGLTDDDDPGGTPVTGQ